MRRLTSISFMLALFLLYAWVALALTSCAPQTEEKRVDLAKEERAIRSISMRWLELAKNHNAAGVAALFSDDGIVFQENQEPAVGQTAIQKLATQNHERNPKAIPNWITDRIEIAASGDLAVEYGSWTEMDGGPSGIVENHGKYVTVYRMVNGTWKVTADISVSTKPEDASR